ncbi:hypothetical protein [Polyangium sp. y55x31]|uniref:hypothetical protein n=1 Tax=Polyangium sp. y55x31 TaxID=3042688 RepID=UPI0024827DB8|nr:hypothetical protein [Polyangium sp. y55x31]MDI1482195.1 hypothetical protein [Polyangium sp. y55x31]
MKTRGLVQRLGHRIASGVLRPKPLAAALALASLAPATAFGQDQPWLADRRFTVGPGYRVGDYELHPGVALEFGYDSNFFMRASEGDAPGDPVGAMRLRVTPSFSFSTLGPQRKGGSTTQALPTAEFTGGISLTYNEFFPVSGPQEGKDRMWQQRNLSGLFDVRLNILPSRPWSGSIYASVGRLIQAPQESLLNDAGDGYESYNRFTPNVGAELAWNPGSGLLDWRIGYNFAGTVFESKDFSGLTNIHHTIQTRGRWRFLPRSALLYDARIGIIHYLDAGAKTGSTPLRVQLGYNGLITKNFGALLMAGWGASFYDPPAGDTAETVEDFDSLIGQAEIRYFLTPNPSSDPQAASTTLSSVSLGFTRDFYDAYVGTFFERDRGYLKLTYFFGGRFVVIVDAGVGALVNPAIRSLPSPEEPWTDIRIDASGFAEYRFKDAFGINTTLRYNTRISDNWFQIPEGRDYLQWQQFEAYLGARWLM